jgi:hypothetical protein
VVGDGVLADEQPRADRGVRQAVAGESRDLRLLSRELLASLNAAFADAFARCQQLALGAPRETSMPMLVNISSAIRSCSRASTRRRSRRSHSP